MESARKFLLCPESSYNELFSKSVYLICSFEVVPDYRHLKMGKVDCFRLLTITLIVPKTG